MCLPIMWKLLTGMIAEELYKHLELAELLPDEQKGYRNGKKGTKEQLVIEKMVIKSFKIDKFSYGVGELQKNV